MSERILDAAEDLLGDDGFSLRAVARAIGVTPMALYRHHDGLPALRAALRARGYERLMRGLHQSLAADTPRARLVAATYAYVQFARSNPSIYRLIFATGPPPGHVADPEARRNAMSFRFMVDRIREAMDAGVLSKGDPEARAIDWWALFHGLVMLQADDKLKLDEPAFDAQVASTLEWLLGR